LPFTSRGASRQARGLVVTLGTSVAGSRCSGAGRRALSMTKLNTPKPRMAIQAKNHSGLRGFSRVLGVSMGVFTSLTDWSVSFIIFEVIVKW